jgi:hypothetical protein
VLFRRTIHLSVSRKHWTEVTYEGLIQVQSVINKSKVAIKARRIILLLSLGVVLYRGTMSY